MIVCGADQTHLYLAAHGRRSGAGRRDECAAPTAPVRTRPRAPRPPRARPSSFSTMCQKCAAGMSDEDVDGRCGVAAGAAGDAPRVLTPAARAPTPATTAPGAPTPALRARRDRIWRARTRLAPAMPVMPTRARSHARRYTCHVGACAARNSQGAEDEA